MIDITNIMNEVKMLQDRVLEIGQDNVKWRQIAIREHARNLALQYICPEGGCLVSDNDINDFLLVSDDITRQSAKDLDEKAKHIIIPEERDVDILLDCITEIEELSDLSGCDLSDILEMLRRWQSQLYQWDDNKI